MKTIAKTFVLFLLTANLFAQTTYNYNDIFFLDENDGWILGTNGNLWKTTNTGITWEHIYNNDINGGIGLQFTSSTTGWMTKQSELFTTSDGGYTWRIVFTNPYTLNHLNSYFINDSVGFIASDSALEKSTLFRTTDEGDNWIVLTDTLIGFITPYFFSENLGFIVCKDGDGTRVFKTTDLGNIWNQSNECFSYLDGCNFGPIQMLNENEGYMAHHWVTTFAVTSILKTTNGGNTWEGGGFSNPIFNFGVKDINYLSFQNGWVTTNNKNIFRTTSAGVSWDTLQRATTLDDVIKNIEFFNSNISYGISSNHIYYTNDGWVTYSIVDSIVTNVENPGTIPNEFTLYQNYPNPFNPTTVISYQLPVSGNVTLKIYDLLGREVAVLVDENKPAGKYEVEFNAFGLSSGAYYYQLIDGDKIEIKKMILLR
jgi:photosystem II stability/assembly factor-like uncharacterized protein